MKDAYENHFHEWGGGGGGWILQGEFTNAICACDMIFAKVAPHARSPWETQSLKVSLTRNPERGFNDKAWFEFDLPPQGNM